MGGSARQRLQQRAHVPRDESRGIEDRVPIPSSERGEIPVAVALDLLQSGEEVGVGLAAVEERDLVPRLERGLDVVAAQEGRAAKDQNFQARSHTEAMPWPTPMHIVATP